MFIVNVKPYNKKKLQCNKMIANILLRIVKDYDYCVRNAYTMKKSKKITEEPPTKTLLPIKDKRYNINGKKQNEQNR